MENEVINHFCHEHPLILKENVSENEILVCYGCDQPITNLEKTYVCIEQHCRTKIILHKKCGELPSRISHPKHPQHPIHLVDFHHLRNHWCDLCRRDLGMVLGYRCSSCDFDLDITCEKLGINTLIEEKRLLDHPSHHDHLLTLMRKPAFSFYCDGCGSQDMDMAYICTTCELWFHKTCATLPLILPLNLQYHHHQLSLAFSFPAKYRYREFGYKCDVCDKDFDMTCWVYFCGDCRFFSHIKCVTSTKREEHFDLNNEDDGVIQFPLYVNDIFNDVITPFVIREKGLKKIPDVEDMPKIVRMPKTTTGYSFLFNYHKHPLNLIIELSNKDEEEEDKADEYEETYDELKICDVCVTPISSLPYYQCAPCKYFVHFICYLLPNTLAPSSSEFPHLYGDHCPETHDNHHIFKLYTSLKSTDMDPRLCKCELCGQLTTGMLYECESCNMRIDVKCASLPSTIKHAFHSHHKPLVMTRISPDDDCSRWKSCHGCEDAFYDCIAYCCSSDDCDFALDFKCVMLPRSIRKHEWDKHSLLLTFKASLDHPSDFYCEFCEVEMHPKKWMYHCRQCDHSFHLPCLRTASGWYRNIKFGRQFVLDDIHPHPLTFNCVTLKRRCDICHVGVYNYCGLECASCYYVVCLYCTRKVLIKMHFS